MRDHETMNADPDQKAESATQEPTDTYTMTDAYPMFGRCGVCGNEHYIEDPYQCERA